MAALSARRHATYKSSAELELELELEKAMSVAPGADTLFVDRAMEVVGPAGVAAGLEARFGPHAVVRPDRRGAGESTSRLPASARAQAGLTMRIAPGGTAQ